MTQSVRKLLLVGWDGADWQVIQPLIQAGRMPQTARLIREGASGPLRSLPPFLSPMIWTSIATGKRPQHHGIHGFTEVNPHTRKVQPVSSGSRRCKALWNILSENAIPSSVVGWFVSHPAEPVHGVCVSEAMNHPPGDQDLEWPAPRGSVHPASRLPEMAALRVRPEEIDVQVLDLLVPRWREVRQTEDPRLLQLILRLAELYTVHNMAVTIARSQPSGFIGVYYHFLDWISHDFMEFHPPRRENVDEALFELYRDVVAHAYRLQDLLLTDLLNQSGAGTTLVLVSDHGFLSDEQRPARNPNITAGIATWHRPYGILALGGPGVAVGVDIRRASVLDIAPTVLTLLGLPAAADMDGRPLGRALDLPPGPAMIPSWEERSGPLQFARPDPAITGDQADLLLRQFADLGYIRMPKGEDAAACTARENAWNLGVTLMDAGEYEQALPHLEEAYFHQPELGHIAFQLALCQLRLGLDAESRQTAETIRDAGSDHPMANFILGQLEMARGTHSEALALLEKARMLDPHLAGVDAQIGLACLHLEQWAQARACFDRVVSRCPRDALGWLGLARANFRDQFYDQALAQAQKAVALDDSLYLAHLTLAQIYDCLKLPEPALQAYQNAFDLEPGLRQARRRLLALLPGSLNGLERRLEVMREIARSRLDSQLSATAVEALRRECARRRIQREQMRASARAATKPVDRLVPPPTPGLSGRTFVLITGLPRSGTSLMMQMLQRGGMELMTDGQRAADIDNPQGYFEWEAIKELPRRPQLIEQASGKAVKVITALLPCLPAEHRYKVIFMRRSPEEIARSQRKMMEREGKQPLPEELAIEGIRQHAQQAQTFLSRGRQFEVLAVDYPDLVANPAPWIARLQAFLGREQLPHGEAMADAVQPKLYRNRILDKTLDTSI